MFARAFITRRCIDLDSPQPIVANIGGAIVDVLADFIEDV